MIEDVEKKLDAILQELKSLNERMTRVEEGSIGPAAAQTISASASKNQSIKEFLLENPPPTDIHRTLAVGHFLETYAGMSAFTKADLEKGYADARESKPSNIGVNISRCIKQGHLMEASEKKDNKTAYVVTRSGEQFLKGGYKKLTGK